MSDGDAFFVWPEGDAWVAQCLDVDVASCGDSRDDAIENLKEAIELYYQDEPVIEDT